MALTTRIHKLERERAKAPCPVCPTLPGAIVCLREEDVPSNRCPRCGREKDRLVILGIDPEAMYGPGEKAEWERTLREREAAR